MVWNLWMSVPCTQCNKCCVTVYSSGDTQRNVQYRRYTAQRSRTWAAQRTVQDIICITYSPEDMTQIIHTRVYTALRTLQDMHSIMCKGIIPHNVQFRTNTAQRTKESYHTMYSPQPTQHEVQRKCTTQRTYKVVHSTTYIPEDTQHNLQSRGYTAQYAVQSMYRTTYDSERIARRAVVQSRK